MIESKWCWKKMIYKYVIGEYVININENKINFYIL